MSTCHACGAESPVGARYCPACGAGLGAVSQSPRMASKIFEYIPHPHIEHRKRRAPGKGQAPPPEPGLAARFNTWLGVKITNGVGTMWCAYGFAAIALISLPEAIRGGSGPLVSWIAQTFLQLVLLSIIMVGQKVEGAASENRAINTYQDAEAILAEAVEIQKHLLAQDALLNHMIQAHAAQDQL